MKHLNPIRKFRLNGIKINEKGIFKLTEGFLVENYASLQDCSKSVSKSLKRAKSDGYHGTIFAVRQSGAEEFVKRF